MQAVYTLGGAGGTYNWAVQAVHTTGRGRRWHSGCVLPVSLFKGLANGAGYIAEKMSLPGMLSSVGGGVGSDVGILPGGGGS